MFLESIYGKNFRNFETLQLKLEPGKNLILGDNGAGKTNIIELVYFLSTFSSFRTSTDSDLIRFGESFLIASGKYGDTEVEVKYSGGSKEVFVNGVNMKRLRDAFGTIPVIALVSDDLEIVNGPPARRRRFLNIGISMWRKDYIELLSEYRRAWKQRNNLLKKACNGGSLKGIDIWEKQMSEKAEPISRMRADYLDKLRKTALPEFRRLTGQSLELRYGFGGSRRNLLAQLMNNRKREIERGYSLYGPHRDDIIFRVDGRQAKVASSFGIKRILTVSLRLAQAKILRDKRDEEPVLLLDEVVGELDTKRMDVLSDILKEFKQVLISTTRENMRESGIFNVLRVEDNDGTPSVRKCSEKINSIK